jgi:tetratricopeptide (TPR) repeat protein
MNAVLGQPCGRKAPKPSLARAEHLLAAGDVKGAILSAKRVLGRDRDQIGALEVLAKALWQMGRYDELLAALATMIRLNPYEPGYHALRGAVYQAVGRTGEAIKSFARADSETSAASVEELREWQGEIIARLLGEDPVFKAHYTQNPEEACQARGFEFLADFNPGESWFLKPQAQAAIHTRPS